ncbi:uncharacterized protein BDW70DRAFT_161597 [Aspergillus foveolatus]|uniref:uncharacterized protein n=1 Tax=Aspergillus foveolatus TaxID=210207 RepID=UPI003CCD8A8F
MPDDASEGSSDGSWPSTDLTNDPLYNYEQCITALEGTRVPDDLSSSTARCAVYRVVRCSYDFATNSEIIDLCGRLPQYPEILRARNTRLIMGNVVPEDLEIPEAQSCCIWNPNFAEEDTYANLLSNIPLCAIRLAEL